MFAQDSAMDSIKNAMKEKPRFVLSFHNRNTFVKADEVKLYGLQAGLDYSEHIKFFIALYGFSNESKKWLVNSEVFEADSVLKATSLSYISFGVEHSFYQKGRLTLRTPVQIGIGSVTNDHFSDGELLLRDMDVVIPIESGINAYFKLIDWLILKSGVGYRINLGNSEVLKMSSPYYNLGISIAVIPLYHRVFNMDKE